MKEQTKKQQKNPQDSTQTNKILKRILDFHYESYNSQEAINRQNLDPLLKVKEYINNKKSTKNLDEIAYVALVCALFAYGNVRAILKFLDSLDFGLLDSSKEIVASDFPYYRFQKAIEVKLFFLALCEMKQNRALESILHLHKSHPKPIYLLINECIEMIWQVAKKYAIKLNYTLESHTSKPNGFAFLVGTPLPNTSVLPSSPLKRWNMFLRWMVREDNVDLGLWREYICPSELLLPLDTHTFGVCRALGLLNRKSYDFKAVLEVSENLARFDKDDPIKYDFALYRLGQKGVIKKGEKVDFAKLLVCE